MHESLLAKGNESESSDSLDLKILVGTEISQVYAWQERQREVSEDNVEDNQPVICYFCNQSIKPDEPINLHHPIYRSRGGTETKPAHERCHVEFHRRSGDFREWGRISSLTRRWAWNLKNVRNNPAYEFDRQYYLALYAH